MKLVDLIEIIYFNQKNVNSDLAFLNVLHQENRKLYNSYTLLQQSTQVQFMMIKFYIKAL